MNNKHPSDGELDKICQKLAGSFMEAFRRGEPHIEVMAKIQENLIAEAKASIEALIDKRERLARIEIAQKILWEGFEPGNPNFTAPFIRNLIRALSDKHSGKGGGYVEL